MRLTIRLKTVSVDSSRVMGRPQRLFVFAGLLAVGCAVFLGGCASVRNPDQIKFGLWAAERNLWDEAIFRWQKVLAVDPSSVSAHNNLAVAYEKKGLWDKARAAYEAALKIDPKNTYVKTNFDRFKEQQDSLKKKEEKEKVAEKEKKAPGSRP